jgi:hypothetical protein
MSNLLPVMNKLRKRPGMYIGEPSLTKLAAFLLGYDCAFFDLKGEPADPFFVSFQEWIEQRLKIKYQGWDKAILSECGSEAEGFDRFWELYDEYVTQSDNGTQTAAQQRNSSPRVEQESRP